MLRCKHVPPSQPPTTPPCHPAPLQVSLPTQYNNRNQDPVGALSSALARLQSNRPLRELREVAKGITKQLPQPIQVATSKIDEYARGMISGSGSTLFEELGLYYIGPVDGHNLDDLVTVLNDVRAADTVGPVLVHVITEKGRGYLPAETAQDKMHGVVKFDPRTGIQAKAAPAKAGSYTNYFADALIAEAERDSRIVAIHAAMAGGTGATKRRRGRHCCCSAIAAAAAVMAAAHCTQQH